MRKGRLSGGRKSFGAIPTLFKIAHSLNMGPSRGRYGRTEGRIWKRTTDLKSGRHPAIFGTLHLFLTLALAKLNFWDPNRLQWDLLGGAPAERKAGA